METNSSLALCQGTEEWLAMRRSKIGSSDASVIMGTNPFGMTVNKLWKQKKGLLEDFKPTAAMQRGSDMEQHARKWFELKTDTLYFPYVMFHKEHDFLMSSLDGMDLHGQAIIEIKCPGHKVMKEVLDGKIPEYWKTQVYHHLLVTGLPECTLIAYDGFDGKIFVIKRDEDYIGKLLQKELEFYRYLQSDTPPPCDDDDHIEIQANDFMKKVIRHWKEVSKQLDSLKEMQDALKEQIIAMSNDSNASMVDEVGMPLVKISKVEREGAVDWRSVCKTFQIDDDQLELYRKPGVSYWKLSGI